MKGDVKIEKSDLALIKIAMIFFAFFLLKLIPQLFFWVDDTSIWIFLILTVLFMIRPVYRRLRG